MHVQLLTAENIKVIFDRLNSGSAKSVICKVYQNFMQVINLSLNHVSCIYPWAIQFL